MDRNVSKNQIKRTSHGSWVCDHMYLVINVQDKHFELFQDFEIFFFFVCWKKLHQTIFSIPRFKVNLMQQNEFEKVFSCFVIKWALAVKLLIFKLINFESWRLGNRKVLYILRIWMCYSLAYWKLIFKNRLS